MLSHFLRYEQGYDASYSYDETSHDSSYNQGRQLDFTQDYLQDDRAQPRNKKRLVPSEPSPHVIFLGLDPDFTEADVRRLFISNTILIPITDFIRLFVQLQAYLSGNGCSIETVTIIRERSTGTCPFVFVFFSYIDVSFVVGLSKVYPRALDLPNLQALNMLAHLWTLFSRLYKYHLRRLMVLLPPQHSTKHLRPVLVITGGGSRLITLKVPHPMKKAVRFVKT